MDGDFGRDSVEKVPSEPVTAVLTWRVTPGREAEFETWAQQILNAVRARPGFVGSTTLRPPRLQQPYHIVLRFVDAEHLSTWMNSPERAQWTSGVEGLATQYCAGVTGLENWFDLPGLPLVAPPRWKTALIAFIGVYPIVLLFTLYIAPLYVGQPLPLRALYLPLFLSPTLTYVLMPCLTRVFRRWLIAR